MESKRIIEPPKTRAIKAGRVRLAPGEEVGEHITEKREEILIVLKGTAILIKENEKIELKKGEMHYIKENTKHNVLNNSNEELEYVYVVCLL